MRKLLIATAVLALSAPAWAGPKDQTKDSLIGKDALAGNATVNNATTAFSFASKGCTVQIKAKGLTGLADGQKIICVAGADVISPPTLVALAGNSVVIVGEVKAGGLGIKADLTEIGCGGADNIQVNGTLQCYLDDSNYRTGTGPGGWNAQCLTQAFTAAVPNAAASPKTLKSDPTQLVVPGLCQGLTLGTRIPPPASAEIARRGSRGFAN